MKRSAIVSLLASIMACLGLATSTIGGDNASAGEILDRAVTAVGGAGALANLKSLRAHSVNTRIDLGQSFAPAWDEDLSKLPREYFITDTYVDFGGGRRYWHRRLNNSNYINIMGAEWAANTTDGTTNAQGTNITDLYVHRNRHMTFPGILFTALEKKADLKRLADAHFEGRTHYVLGLSDLGKDLRVFVDQQSGMVSKVEFDLPHPVRDKATCEYRYGKWRKLGDLQLPFLTEGLNTQNGTSHWTIEEMTVELNAPEGDRFAVAESIRKASTERIARERPNPAAPVIAAQKLAEGVYHLRGQQNNLVIEMTDFLMIVDTPADSARSERILARVKELIPNKPVRAVVFSHWHHDHSGGLRVYAATGVPVYAGAANRSFIERMLAAPSSNSSGQAPRSSSSKSQLKWVSKPEALVAGGRKVVILPIPNPHVDGMLAVFVQDVGVLFISDLFPSDDARMKEALLNFVGAHKLDVKTIAPSHGPARTWDQFLKGGS